MKSSILILLLISLLISVYGILQMISYNVGDPFWSSGKIIAPFELFVLVLSTIHILYVVILFGYLLGDLDAIDPDVFIMAMIPLLSPGLVLGIPFAIMGWLAYKRKPEQFG